MAVSDETKDMLADVKKGKTRKFVLLTKGASIVSLVLYKKGQPAKFIKEAKESGKGAVSYGVVEGGGTDLTMRLAVADGFKDAPVKDLVLKKFLEDEADFKCKPKFEIVEALPVVLDETDPLHARFLKIQVEASQASDKDADKAAAIATLVRQIGGHLDADQRDQGESKLGELEALLRDIASGKSAPGPEGDKQREAYLTLRQKLEPLLLQAQKTSPDKATALNAVWAYAGQQAESGNYAGANKGLTGLADAIKKALIPAEKPVGGAKNSNVAFTSARLEWDRARKEVLKDLESLESTILNSFAALPGFPQDRLEAIAANSSSLYRILDDLDNQLIDVLDAGLNASDPEKRTALYEKAGKVVGQCQKYVKSSRLVSAVEANPFKKIDVRGRLTATLNELAAKLN